MSNTILAENQSPRNTLFAIGTLAGDPIRVRCDLCGEPTPLTQVELATYKGRTHKPYTGVPYRVCPMCAERIRAAKAYAIELPVRVAVGAS